MSQNSRGETIISAPAVLSTGSKVPAAGGFHDEPLKGKRQGQRSVRLNRAYRAIYVERGTGAVELIEVLEVNKHEYR